MKTSEEILLEEVKAQYSRQLITWEQLLHKSQIFLQLNGLILSMIIIALGFVIDKLITITIVLILITLIFVSISIITTLIYVIRGMSLKDTKVVLEDDFNMEGKEKEIIVSLIRVYQISQNTLDKKYKKKSHYFDNNIIIFNAALMFLISVIGVVLLS